MSLTLNSKVYSFAQFDRSGASRFVTAVTGVISAVSTVLNRVVRRTGSTSKADTVEWQLTIPVVATEDSACSCDGTVLRTHYVKVTYDCPKTSSLAERQDARLQLKDLVATAQFIAAWDNEVQATS